MAADPKPKYEDVYETIDDLGEGGFAKVYKCKKKETGDIFAVKVMEKKTSTEEDIKAFKGEYEILKSLDHPHLVKLYDLFEDDTKVRMVMELASGGEVFYKIIELKNYCEETASTLMKNILEAIAYMHENGVAHRDLKPENLLLANEKGEHDDDRHLTEVKVVDFGFAAKFTKGEPSFTKGCGTDVYLAPEVIKAGVWKQGGKYSEKCDIWSLGVITYILLTGRFPFHAPQPDQLMKKIVSGQFKFSGPIWKKITPQAKEFITALLTVDPDKRLSAAKALAHPWIQNVSELEANPSFTEPLTQTIEEIKTHFIKWQNAKGKLVAVRVMQKLLLDIRAREEQAATIIQKRWRSKHQHQDEKGDSQGKKDDTKTEQAANKTEEPKASSSSSSSSSDKKDNNDQPMEEDKDGKEVEEKKSSEIDYNSWKVVDLRATLRERGLSATGKKTVLVKRLRDSLKGDDAPGTPKGKKQKKGEETYGAEE